MKIQKEIRAGLENDKAFYLQNFWPQQADFLGFRLHQMSIKLYQKQDEYVEFRMERHKKMILSPQNDSICQQKKAFSPQEGMITFASDIEFFCLHLQGWSLIWKLTQKNKSQNSKLSKDTQIWNLSPKNFRSQKFFVGVFADPFCSFAKNEMPAHHCYATWCQGNSKRTR